MTLTLIDAKNFEKGFKKLFSNNVQVWTHYRAFSRAQTILEPAGMYVLGTLNASQKFGSITKIQVWVDEADTFAICITYGHREATKTHPEIHKAHAVMVPLRDFIGYTQEQKIFLEMIQYLQEEKKEPPS